MNDQDPLHNGPQSKSDAPFNLPTEDSVGQMTPELKSDTIPQPALEEGSQAGNEDLDKALQDELENFNTAKSKRSPIATRIAFLAIGLALLILLVIGAYVTYNRFIKNSGGVQTVKDAIQDVTANPNSDDDKDGLTNKQEVEMKTDPAKADTDDDDLEDGLEVNTYKSDPLKNDSDGDGFSDGQEVSSGFNPIGAGKLRK